MHTTGNLIRGMGNLTVRKIDDRVKERLRVRAARRGVSMEEEARRILSAAGEEGPAQTNIADAIAGIMDPLGGVDLHRPNGFGGSRRATRRKASANIWPAFR